MSTKQKGWDTTTGGTHEKGKRWEDSVEKLDLTKDYQTIRFLQGPTAGAKHWVEFKNAEGQKKGFYTPCFSFNRKTDSFEKDSACPACMAGIKSAIFYAANVVVRSIQEEKPESVKREKPDENGFKTKENKAWSPVRVLVVPATVSKKIRQIITLNKYKNAEGKMVTKTVEDPKFGLDLEVSYDKDAEGAQMYDVQKGDKSKLTDEEKAYLLYDLGIIPNFLNSQETDSIYYKEKVDLAKSLKSKGMLGKKDDEDDEEEAPKSKRRSDDDDEDDDDVASFDESDSDEDAPPKKKKKPVVEDEEDSDEDDEDPPPKKKKKPVDEDEDDDSDSDEDDAPAPKKKKKPVEDEDDEDEEEEAPPKKKKKPVVEDDEDDEDEDEDLPPKKKKKPVVEDDEEEDDEEESAPPPKKKKKAVEAEDSDWD
jgi:hypothetical protein